MPQWPYAVCSARLSDCGVGHSKAKGLTNGANIKLSLQ